jgi:hypothetical protein
MHAARKHTRAPCACVFVICCNSKVDMRAKGVGGCVGGCMGRGGQAKEHTHTYTPIYILLVGFFFCVCVNVCVLVGWEEACANYTARCANQALTRSVSAYSRTHPLTYTHFELQRGG